MVSCICREVMPKLGWGVQSIAEITSWFIRFDGDSVVTTEKFTRSLKFEPKFVNSAKVSGSYCAQHATTTLTLSKEDQIFTIQNWRRLAGWIYSPSLSLLLFIRLIYFSQTPTPTSEFISSLDIPDSSSLKTGTELQ